MMVGTWEFCKTLYSYRPGCVFCREVLEHLANTLVFILIGAVIAGEVWTNERDFTLVTAKDWGYAILLWVSLLVS